MEKVCCPTTTSILSPAFVPFGCFVLLTWQEKKTQKEKTKQNETKNNKQVVSYWAGYVTVLLEGCDVLGPTEREGRCCCSTRDGSRKDQELRSQQWYLLI